MSKHTDTPVLLDNNYMYYIILFVLFLIIITFSYFIKKLSNNVNEITSKLDNINKNLDKDKDKDEDEETAVETENDNTEDIKKVLETVNNNDKLDTIDEQTESDN
jgi:predicted Holliday junction resolvase-like endonuclease